MKRISQKIVLSWSSLGTRFLPFADAASPDLPLSRLLRLSLFQVSVGMALVLLVGTLNRVMIVEMKVPATLVSTMVALPLLFAPLRALIGFRSDNHRSELGWRRVPYIWMGTLMQFGGFSIMPFALLVLAGAGQSAEAPAWIGQLGAAVAFLLVGAGLHTTQTVGLALATDLAPTESQPKVVGLMYVMLLVGMIVSAIAFGDLLTDLDGLSLPAAQWPQQDLYAMVDAIRLKESTYKSAGSVHACALFHKGDMKLFVEDVGRHNAIDTIAGWMWMHGIHPAQAPIDSPWAFYTTGRLTSEMVLKAAQMQVPVVVSRSGITQMGFEMAQRLGLCTVGRATHKRFLCYTAPQVLLWQPELAQTTVKRAHT